MGRTAMHLSAANGHRELISQLIGQGADINAPDEVSVDDRVFGCVVRVPERQSTERFFTYSINRGFGSTEMIHTFE